MISLISRISGYFREFSLLLIPTLIVYGCASTGGPLGPSPEQAQALGRQEHPKIVAAFGGEVQDPELSAYVDGIVRRLLATSGRPDEQIKTTVLDSPIVNAMALPGHIYATRGLIALHVNRGNVVRL